MTGHFPSTAEHLRLCFSASHPHLPWHLTCIALRRSQLFIKVLVALVCRCLLLFLLSLDGARIGLFQIRSQTHSRALVATSTSLRLPVFAILRRSYSSYIWQSKQIITPLLLRQLTLPALCASDRSPPATLIGRTLCPILRIFFDSTPRKLSTILQRHQATSQKCGRLQTKLGGQPHWSPEEGTQTWNMAHATSYTSTGGRTMSMSGGRHCRIR